jgi:PPOX class probable F420-dependent enzyme
MNPYETFAKFKYVQMLTFRKSGQSVPTPMWYGIDPGGKMYMQTNVAAGKVKRLRNRPEVEICPSTSRGKPLGAIWNGRATVHPPDSPVAEKSLRLLAEHYGWVFRIFYFFLRVFRRKLAYIEIELDPKES